MIEQDNLPIQVLLVEDDTGDAGLAQIALRGFRNASFNVVWAQTLAEAIRQFDCQCYDIVLLDLTLPDSSGIDTLARLLHAAGSTPVIVLTGHSDTEFGLSTLKAGATDYLVKGDFGYDGLARTIFYILHRTKLEQELAEYRFQLEKLVAERTAELALAKDAAEAANRAKTAFLANMSHELRTPLNAILGFAQLMARDSSLDEQHRNELQTINRSGRHLLSLINDVLEIARIEAGRTSIQSKPFDLMDILHSVEEMIRLRARSKDLQFVIEQHGKLPYCVLGDAHHLRQVLLNLLGNAVKYTDQGRVTLRVTALDTHISFEVIDTGLGIAASEQQRIFQAFYQTEAGAALGEGAGLGLTISRELVRLMGGDISVESEPGQGSIFAFTLPLPATDAVLQTIPHTRVLGLKAAQTPVRILVAEDQADSRDMIVRLLTSVGFDTRGVENGLQAVESFRDWQPHFIWMDIRMPVMDGFEAVRQIRALPGGADVKIVALTASVFQERLGDILVAGCDDILSKPFEEEELFRIMGDLLNLQYRYAETDDPPSKAPCNFSLMGVSQELRDAIRRAAELLDIDAFSDIIIRLRSTHPSLADELERLVRDFRFAQIQQAIDSGR